MAGGESVTVAIDTSVLINLALVDRLDLLGAVDGHQFKVPLDVLVEVEHPEQRQKVKVAIASGHLKSYKLTGTDLLSRRAEFLQDMGSGESACLALAVEKGWLVACDEKRLFRRIAIQILGQGRLLNTVGLFLLGIRQGYWSVEDADRAKDLLAANRYRVKLRTFRDLL